MDVLKKKMQDLQQKAAEAEDALAAQKDLDTEQELCKKSEIIQQC